MVEVVFDDTREAMDERELNVAIGVKPGAISVATESNSAASPGSHNTLSNVVA